MRSHQWNLFFPFHCYPVGYSEIHLHAIWFRKLQEYYAYGEVRKRERSSTSLSSTVINQSLKTSKCKVQSIKDLLAITESKPLPRANRTNMKHSSWRWQDKVLQVEAGLTLDTDVLFFTWYPHAQFSSLKFTNISLSLYPLSHFSSLSQTRKSFPSIRKYINQNG